MFTKFVFYAVIPRRATPFECIPLLKRSNRVRKQISVTEMCFGGLTTLVSRSFHRTTSRQSSANCVAHARNQFGLRQVIGKPLGCYIVPSLGKASPSMGGGLGGGVNEAQWQFCHFESKRHNHVRTVHLREILSRPSIGRANQRGEGRKRS